MMFTFFRFQPEKCLKIQNYLFKVEFNILTNFEYAEFNCDVHSFRFRLEISFLGKFGRENQNCQFKLKFGV